jgi:hypothetical protein
MHKTPTLSAAVPETAVFQDNLKDLHDPTQRDKVCYPLDEMLLLCRLAVRAGDD